MKMDCFVNIIVKKKNFFLIKIKQNSILDKIVKIIFLIIEKFFFFFKAKL